MDIVPSCTKEILTLFDVVFIPSFIILGPFVIVGLMRLVKGKEFFAGKA
jgi:hypothetical protein